MVVAKAQHPTSTANGPGFSRLTGFATAAAAFGRDHVSGICNGAVAAAVESAMLLDLRGSRLEKQAVLLTTSPVDRGGDAKFDEPDESEASVP